MTIGNRQNWTHGDTAMSGGLWGFWTPDTDDDRRIFLFIRDRLRIFTPWGEDAYSKDWCSLAAEDIAYIFEYRKTGNIFKDEKIKEAYKDIQKDAA